MCVCVCVYIYIYIICLCGKRRGKVEQAHNIVPNPNRSNHRQLQWMVAGGGGQIFFKTLLYYIKLGTTDRFCKGCPPPHPPPPPLFPNKKILAPVKTIIILYNLQTQSNLIWDLSFIELYNYTNSNTKQVQNINNSTLSYLIISQSKILLQFK